MQAYLCSAQIEPTLDASRSTTFQSIMSTIINKPLLIKLSAEINAALADVAKANGITLVTGSASYTADGRSATFKLAVEVLAEGGIERDIPAELFMQNATFVGLKPEHLGEFITLQGRKFKISGFKPKATKNCIVIKDATTGKTFVTDADTVKRQLTK